MTMMNHNNQILQFHKGTKASKNQHKKEETLLMTQHIHLKYHQVRKKADQFLVNIRHQYQQIDKKY